MRTSGRPAELAQDECDFCSNHQVVRRYQCMDFAAESKAAGVMYDKVYDKFGPINVVLRSYNYWAACAECASFVDAEDLDGLLRHVVKTLCGPTRMHGKPRGDFIRHARYTYELFFKNRIRVTEE